MAANDNLIFKTNTTKTIDDLFNWDREHDEITANTTSVPIVPGTVYFTSDGYIVYDIAAGKRLWMGKEAYSAIYAKDIADDNDLADLIASAHAYWANLPTQETSSDITEPTFKTARLVATQGATKSAKMEYNATTETLNFVFTS